jgi:ferrochelatase
MFQVSRPTIRTALQQLAKDGLIEIRQGRRNRLLAASTHTAAPRSRLVVLVSHQPISQMTLTAYHGISEMRAHLAEQGFTTIIALVLAPHYSSYSIGQYVGRATEAATPHGITVIGIDSWAIEPAFVRFIANDMAKKRSTMPARTRVLFTAHSLPQRIIDAGDPYPQELHATASAVAQQLNLSEGADWGIAWQSAGRTPEPWIGPDILAVLQEIADTKSADGVVVSACGFVADHLEVLYDLDIEAQHLADNLGLAFARTACVNDDAEVMAALAQRVIGAAQHRE